MKDEDFKNQFGDKMNNTEEIQSVHTAEILNEIKNLRHIQTEKPLGQHSAHHSSFSAESSLEFRLVDGQAVVAGVKDENLVSVIIPQSIICEDRSYIVTKIGKNAFKDCGAMTSIIIPNSIISIGDSAFLGCEALISIEIPNSVITIGNHAFWGCDALRSINIPDSIKSIGDEAFSYCSSLKSIEIPSSVKSIGKGAFSHCENLKAIYVSGESLYYTGIDGNLYSRDVKILIQYVIGKKNKEFVIPDGVNTIGQGAFLGCKALNSIEIPNSVKSIGDSAFFGCESLKSIKIPSSVKTIGEGAFRYCESLTSVEISKSVQSIANYTFFGCEALTSIIIPESVEYIGEGAFEDCNNLKSVIFEDPMYWMRFLDKETNVQFERKNWYDQLCVNVNKSNQANPVQGLKSPEKAAEYLRSEYKEYCWEKL